MSLTSGSGPLGPHPAGRFTPAVPDHVVYVEPHLRRVRAVLAGREVLDSERAVLVHRPGRGPTYAFPPGDVTGVAAEPEPAAPGFVRVGWGAVDAWFEEDEEVVDHPRNPYHRVDCIRGHRRLHVDVGGTVLVDTDDTLGVYETSLAPKLYVERRSVRMDVLVPSSTTTYCPYKGTASYWSAVVAETVTEDVAWSYEDPLPECSRLAGFLSFDATSATVRADVVEPG